MAVKQFRFLLFCFCISNLYGQNITVSNAVLNFGVVYETSPDSLPLTVYNNTGKNVTITGIRFYNIYGQPAFSCPSSYFTLGNGSTGIIWVKFAPRHNIYHNSEMVIETDAQRGGVSVDLIGQGRYSKSYYSTSENTEEESLKTSLQNITGAGYTSLGYNIARDSMFMWLDNQKVNGQGAAQNTLECVYTGRLAVGYTDRTDCQTNDQFNTEHTYPQGYFNSLEPMKSDLHHLFPTDDMANNVRASYPFGVVTNATWTNGGSKFDNNTNIFEPRDIHKGPAARAMLYFVIRYQNYANFLNSQEAILKTWNKNFDPSYREQKRNDDIFTIQNNRNPFVDYPQFADRITSFSTTSLAPVVYAIDKTQTEINYGAVLFGVSTLYHYVIVNNGNQTIQFTNFNLSNNSILSFAGNSGTNVSIDPGDALGIDIDIHPSAVGSISENLYFQTSVPAIPTVTIPIVAISSATGIYNTNSTSVNLYPNPAHDYVYISRTDNCSMSIVNLTGQLLDVPVQKQENDYRVDITTVPPGFYLLQMTDSKNYIQHHTFIKY